MVKCGQDGTPCQKPKQVIEGRSNVHTLKRCNGSSSVYTRVRKVTYRTGLQWGTKQKTQQRKTKSMQKYIPFACGTQDQHQESTNNTITQKGKKESSIHRAACGPVTRLYCCTYSCWGQKRATHKMVVEVYNLIRLGKDKWKISKGLPDSKGQQQENINKSSPESECRIGKR